MNLRKILGLDGDALSARFNDEFAHEILVSERLRATIICCVLGVSLALEFALPAVFDGPYFELFRTTSIELEMLTLLGGALCYELLVRFVIGRFIRRRLHPPAIARYINVLIETSIPSIGLMILASHISPVDILNTPISLVYFLFIILSVLRLDFILCLFTGCLAALEYSIVSVTFINNAIEAGNVSLATEPSVYIGKAWVMFLGGVVAGYVAVQVRQRFIRSYRLLDERNQIVNLFGQQVSQAVVNEMLARDLHIESRRQQVCVMFLDIRDFTPFAEAHSPEDVVAFLNTLFGFMIEIVTHHNGIINQFVGDGFMATFGAPVSDGNDTINALNAARDIVEKVEQLNGYGAIPPTRIGIGIHCGEAVTGNVGSSLRQQYSITGEVVILASRIEQLNKKFDSRLLVSSQVIAASGAQVNAEPLGPVHVKGHQEAIDVYRLA